MAKHNHSVNPEAFIVWDARNGRVLPAIGAGEKARDVYFTQQNAVKMAGKLNAYVLANTDIELAKKMVLGKVSVDGPFYVHPQHQRSTLEGRTNINKAQVVTKRQTLPLMITDPKNSHRRW